MPVTTKGQGWGAPLQTSPKNKGKHTHTHTHNVFYVRPGHPKNQGAAATTD